MPERDNFDRLIDAAIDSYADPGPDNGLTTRILNRIQAERRRRSVRVWMLWAGGFALATSILLIVTVTTGHPHPDRTAAPIEHMTSGVKAPATRAQTDLEPRLQTRTNAAVIRVHPRPHQLMPPKLPVFPSPAPLSAEETALLHLATQTTVDERKAILAAQQKSAEPLHIASLSISPIEPPSEGKE